MSRLKESQGTKTKQEKLRSASCQGKEIQCVSGGVRHGVPKGFAESGLGAQGGYANQVWGPNTRQCRMGMGLSRMGGWAPCPPVREGVLQKQIDFDPP